MPLLAALNREESVKEMFDLIDAKEKFFDVVCKVESCEEAFDNTEALPIDEAPESARDYADAFNKLGARMDLRSVDVSFHARRVLSELRFARRLVDALLVDVKGAESGNCFHALCIPDSMAKAQSAVNLLRYRYSLLGSAVRLHVFTLCDLEELNLAWLRDYCDFPSDAWFREMCDARERANAIVEPGQTFGGQFDLYETGFGSGKNVFDLFSVVRREVDALVDDAVAAAQIEKNLTLPA